MSSAESADRVDRVDTAGAAELFMRERPRLLGLSYRLLGAVADAEDVVQETWLRFERTDRSTIERPEAWLTTVCGRIGLDHLRARQRLQVDYVGPWLPEPIGERLDEDPVATAELSDSLTTSFLLLLERLRPEERLALLMVDVFGEPFSAVADALGKTEPACRQLTARARKKLRHDPPLGPTDSVPAATAIARLLVRAVLGGDLDAVRSLLAPDVVLISDGGAATHAARRPVRFPDRVARFLVNVNRKRLPWLPEITFSEILLNGSPGFLATDPNGRPVLAQSVDVVDDRVVRIHIIANVEKLAVLDRDIRIR